MPMNANAHAYKNAPIPAYETYQKCWLLPILKFACASHTYTLHSVILFGVVFVQSLQLWISKPDYCRSVLLQ